MEVRKGISGSTLKIFAIITMLIDHIGAVVLDRYIRYTHSYDDGFIALYQTLRYIGRLSFPIFIFLVIEGYTHTKNVWKYILRLLLFAILSEIPFDLALSVTKRQFKQGILYSNEFQNVMFTILIGVLTLAIIDLINERITDLFVKGLLDTFVFISALAIAEGCLVDYGSMGVAAILVGYFLRKNKFACIFGICVVLTILDLSELVGLFDIFIIAMYNGKRGLKIKWSFYFFYPVHLLILALISYAII